MINQIYQRFDNNQVKLRSFLLVKGYAIKLLV